MRRTHMGVQLYREGLAPLVIISGGDPISSSDLQSADFMAEFASALGISREAVLPEKQSENTYFSAVHVGAFCRELGSRRVLLVTDAADMRRAVSVFRKQNLRVSPASSDSWAPYWEGRQICIGKFWSAIHEYSGLL